MPKKAKINMDNVIIMHAPDGPHADIGLTWYYSFGNFEGWTRSEEEADQIITNRIKKQS